MAGRSMTPGDRNHLALMAPEAVQAGPGGPKWLTELEQVQAQARALSGAILAAYGDAFPNWPFVDPVTALERLRDEGRRGGAVPEDWQELLAEAERGEGEERARADRAVAKLDALRRAAQAVVDAEKLDAAMSAIRALAAAVLESEL